MEIPLIKKMSNAIGAVVCNASELEFNPQGSISNNVAMQKPNINKYKLNFAAGGEKTVICKFKSHKIIENGISFLNYDNDSVFAGLLSENHKIFGYDESHIREIEFYRGIDDSLKWHLIHIFGFYSNTEEDSHIIVMEEITKNSAIDDKWIIKILDAITNFHAFYYNNPNSVRRLSLNNYSNDDYINNSQLLKLMFSTLDNSIFPANNLEKIKRFIENIGDLRNELAYHMTLTHNDFSPRNIFCAERVYIYDWELACFQNPEHDLVEFLAAIIGEMQDNQVKEIIAHFKQVLLTKINVKISDKEYKKLILFNILEFCINKLSIYRLANKHLKNEFIDKMALNTNRLLNIAEDL